MSDYTPIACSLHDTLELAILAGRRLWVRLRRDGAGEPGRSLVLEPVDLLIEDGAEWLDALDPDGAEIRLRLDWIIDAAPSQR